MQKFTIVTLPIVLLVALGWAFLNFQHRQTCSDMRALLHPDLHNFKIQECKTATRERNFNEVMLYIPGDQLEQALAILEEHHRLTSPDWRECCEDRYFYGGHASIPDDHRLLRFVPLEPSMFWLDIGISGKWISDNALILTPYEVGATLKIGMTPI